MPGFGLFTYINGTETVKKVDLDKDNATTAAKVKVMFNNESENRVTIKAGKAIVRVIYNGVALETLTSTNDFMVAGKDSVVLNELEFTVGSSTAKTATSGKYTVKPEDKVLVTVEVDEKDLGVDLPVTALSDDKTIKTVAVKDAKVTAVTADTKYTAELPFGSVLTDVKASDVVVTPNKATAEAAVEDTTHSVAGERRFTVKVVAADKSEATVEVIVKVATAATDNDIKTITVNGVVYSPTFTGAGTSTDPKKATIKSSSVPETIEVKVDATATVAKNAKKAGGTDATATWEVEVKAQDDSVQYFEITVEKE